MQTSRKTGWIDTHRIKVAATTLSMAIGLVGCNVDMTVTPTHNPTTPPTMVEDSNANVSPGSIPGVTSGEPNNTFALAITTVITADGSAKLLGTVSRRGDLDVFRIGPMTAGDQIIVDATTPSSNLDVAFSIFDGQQRLTFANDDRTSSDFDALGNWTARHDSDSYYLVLSNSAFASPGEETGTYTVDIQFTRGGSVPMPAPQTLVLNFEGATIDSPALGMGTINPFDAALIDQIYSGQTDIMRTLIREAIQQNYERFNVTVIDSTNPNAPPANTTSTLFLGGFNAQSFGVSEQVDLYNVDFCDDALIFTESFQVASFSFVPTVAEMAIAIGNVAAHESGHLLGLNHVDNDLAIMDDRSVVDAFVEDQEFIEAKLSTDIMPIGTQDAALLLAETVGLAK